MATVHNSPAGMVDVTVAHDSVAVTVDAVTTVVRASGPHATAATATVRFVADGGRVEAHVERGDVRRVAVHARDALKARTGSLPTAGQGGRWDHIVVGRQTVGDIVAGHLIELADRHGHPHTGVLSGLPMADLVDALRWPALAGTLRDLGVFPRLADSDADPLAVGLRELQLADAIAVWLPSANRRGRRAATTLAGRATEDDGGSRRVLELATVLDGTLAADQIAELMESTDAGQVDTAMAVPSKAGGLIGQLPASRVQRLVRDALKDGRGQLLADTLRDLIAIADHDPEMADSLLAQHRRWRDLDGLADHAARIVAQLAPPDTQAAPVQAHDADPEDEPTTTLPYPGTLTALHGRPVSDGSRTLRLTVPPDGDQLITWGQQLHNCVGDYRDHVTEGTRYVVALCDGDVARYAIDITPEGRLNQLRGANNQAAPGEVHGQTVDLLREAGLAA